MRIHAKRLLTAGGFVENCILTIKNGFITQIEPYIEPTKVDFHADILTPGLIDLHIHGGEGFNARDFDIDKAAPFLDKLLACGVTDFLMTISTGRKETMRHGLDVTKTLMDMQKRGEIGGARVLGAHLEGPFLSTHRPGAMQLDAIIPPSIEAYEDFFSGYEHVIKLISLSPETPGAEALTRYLLDKGVCVQAGHTNATFEEAQAGFAFGVQSLCHTFNACRPIHHREPGVVTAALLDPAVYCEAICDFEHLHPGTLLSIYAMKGPGRMALISDSVATHGMPDGEYFMEGYHIVVKNGISRTKEGALDGGGAYLDGAVRNMISLGIPPENVLAMAGATPAARMGLTELGPIRTVEGVEPLLLLHADCRRRAHLTAWHEDWTVDFTVLDQAVFREGEQLHAHGRD